MKLESPARRYMDSNRDISPPPLRTRSDASKSQNKVASYLKQTESSMAKNSNDFATSTLPRDRRTSTNSAIRRGKLNSNMKSKFKSTPDLINEKEDITLGNSAKTTDDMSGGGSRKSSINSDRKTTRVLRKSMPATKEQKDIYGIYNYSSASSTTSSVSETNSRCFSPINYQTKKYIREPVSILRPTSAQGHTAMHNNGSVHSSTSEFSLNEAREYLLGKSELTSKPNRPATSRSMPEAMSDHVQADVPNKSADQLELWRTRLDVSPRDPPEKDQTQQGADRSQLKIDLNSDPINSTPTGRFRKRSTFEPHPKCSNNEPREGEPTNFRSPSPSKSVSQLRGQFESSSSDKEPTPPPRRHRSNRYDTSSESRLGYSSSSAEGSPEHSMASYNRRMASRNRSRTPTQIGMLPLIGSSDEADHVFSNSLIAEGSPNYNSGRTT